MEQGFDGRIGVGDWISATSPEDEKLIGYVESVSGGTLKVRVTQCDRPETVGTTVETKTSKAKKLPDYEPSAPEQLRDLIELALLTHDKPWFEELMAKLGAGAAPSPAGRPGRGYPNRLRSRLTGKASGDGSEA
ncbi:hypothetical protein [Paenibacillus flagellatus]|uniref:IDEAL domain-containing protein n=1 Tax=Paenibacillus flagellatus TaxID=2211139 RepID=A0A2V5JZS1_9BACL|nr:hypothetical protein [Paenibacillus flagellatus]PYI50844.1 hypothetical protein DLM86_27640 [Paenibacillus flagellatus]